MAFVEVVAAGILRIAALCFQWNWYGSTEKWRGVRLRDKPRITSYRVKNIRREVPGFSVSVFQDSVCTPPPFCSATIHQDGNIGLWLVPTVDHERLVSPGNGTAKVGPACIFSDWVWKSTFSAEFSK
ncbi:hypothetical protein NC651_019896 [Populus alba x Populus x berolinensis]|nr:hypothetical protein NC651_019896 [Populus alba x Populus x berolinensis]